MREFACKKAKDRFEYMSNLYKTNPEEFERISRKEIDNVIENADPRKRAILYNLQLKIDRSLSKYKDPIARMNRMVVIFWEGVNRFEETLDGKFVKKKNKTSAEIISLFPKINK